jgi:hypothetical protein
MTLFRTAKNWIDDSGYLLREKILQWLQSLVDKALFKIKLEFLREVRVMQIKLCVGIRLLCAYCVGVSLGLNLT